jgi:hypothetical protein
MNQYSKIKNWISETLDNHSWEDYFDLHIDEINPENKNPVYWIDNGVKYLQDANKILENNNHSELIVVLAFSINDEKLEAKNLNSINDIQELLDWSPPSLYIFPRNFKYWEETLKQSKELNMHIEGISKIYLNQKNGSIFFLVHSGQHFSNKHISKKRSRLIINKK